MKKIRKQILAEINRTKEIMGINLNEGSDWWGRLFGGKKRSANIYNLLKSGVQIHMGIPDEEERNATPPYYTERELKAFAQMVNDLDRVFVSEKKIVEYLGKKAGYMDLADLDVLTQIAFKDSDKENKPEKFVDLLVLSGNYDEGEKYSLDQTLDTALSELTQAKKSLNREEEGDCETTNPYNKEKEPDKYDWCQARIDKNNRLKNKEIEEKKKNPLKGTMYGYYRKEQCDQFKPKGLLCWDPTADHASKHEGNKEGACRKCKKTTKVQESYPLNEINEYYRRIMGLKPIMEQGKGSKVTYDGVEYKIVDLIKEKLKKRNIGQTFASAKWDLSGKSLQAVKELSNDMVKFFKAPDLKRIKFEIELAGGASLVPYDGGVGETVDERNMWLAEKRTEAVKKYLQNALNTAGIDNVTVPEPTVTIGTTADGRKTMTPWDPNKGADHDDYTAEQFVNVSFKATGTREVLKALPSFCEKKFKPKQGGQGAAPDYTIYKGKGMRLNLGAGVGKITLQFDAYTVPDKFILTYNGKQYISSNPDTGEEGFVSNLFKKMSQKDLDLVQPKLEAINVEVKKLENDIAESQAIMDSTVEEQTAQIIARLEQEDKDLVTAIDNIKTKIERYGYIVPLPISQNPKLNYLEKYIEHYLGFPNRNIPNVYWYNTKDDNKGSLFGDEWEDSGRSKTAAEKQSEYLNNAYYNLKDEGELDEKWFHNFFKVFEWGDHGNLGMSPIKKSLGYKKLVKNRKKGWKKDELLAFLETMKQLQHKQEKNQEKQFKKMNKEIPAKRKELKKRKNQVEQQLNQELNILVQEMKANKLAIEKLLKKANLSKKEYDWNVRTGGQYADYSDVDKRFAKGDVSTKGYNQALEDAGFDEGMIGPNGEITFDKVLGKNIAWLQVVAPLGGTAWGLNIKCGKDNETKELTKPA